jgi:hypothetical protein
MSTDHRREIEELKEIRRDKGAAYSVRPIATGHVHALRLKADKVFKRLHTGFEIFPSSAGEAIIFAARSPAGQNNQLISFVIRQRPQQHSVDDTKMAVFAPIPRARVMTAMMVNSGRFVSIRAP